MRREDKNVLLLKLGKEILLEAATRKTLTDIKRGGDLIRAMEGTLYIL